MKPPVLLVIVPALNEEASIASVIGEIAAAAPSADVLVVDDGSTDSTAQVARAAGARVLVLPFNLGVGGAMRAGFKFAVEQGYDAVAQIDADGQHDPVYLSALVAALAEADIVIGARFAGEGDYRATGARQAAMRVLSVVLSRVARTRLTDTTSGFKVMGTRALHLFATNYPAEYLGDTIEALVVASRAGLRVRQVPVAMRERQGGVASHNFVKSTIYLVRASLALVVALARPAEQLPPERI